MLITSPTCFILTDMTKKYKLLLLLANLLLLVFILNAFVGFIIFPNSWINGTLIFVFSMANIAIALRASFNEVNKK